MKRFTACMSAILVACAVLLMQGGTAFAALYQGDIGETRFSTVEGTYILKRYVPPQGGASGAYGASSSSGSWSGGGNLTVVPPTPQQGEYEIVDEAQSGWDVTFDFDHSRTFTIYNEAGPTQRIQYRPGGASVYVTNLVDKDSIFDGEYERQASGDFIAYIPGVGERKLPPYIMAGLRIVLDNSVAGLEQGITYPYTSQVPNVGTMWNFTLRKTQPRQMTEIETTPNAAPQTNTANPPRNALYMIVNANDREDWTAFTYDRDTRVFTMYDAEFYGIGKPYSQRRFLSDGRLEVKSLGGGVHTDIYVRDGSGKYETSSEYIYLYVTKGMRLFLQKVH